VNDRTRSLGREIVYVFSFLESTGKGSSIMMGWNSTWWYATMRYCDEDGFDIWENAGKGSADALVFRIICAYYLLAIPPGVEINPLFSLSVHYGEAFITFR